MFRQIRFRVFLAALALTMALGVKRSLAEGFYFGNFERDVQYNGQYILDRSAQGYAGWFDWPYASLPPHNATPSTEYGVTTGDYSIAYQPSKTMFDQGLAVRLQDLPTATRDAAFPAILSHTQLAMDVTWNNDNLADENPSWYEQYDGSGWYGARIELNMNFGPVSGGWHAMGVPDVDTGNPGSPGLWDLDNYPGVHTRTVTWDYSEYLPTLQALYDAGTMDETHGWTEFMLQTTVGTFDLPVTFYIDGWRLTGGVPEPGTLLLSGLALGFVALFSRRTS